MAAAMTVTNKETAREWFKLIEDGVPEDLALDWLKREATNSAAPQKYKDAWKAAIGKSSSEPMILTKVEFLVLRMYTMNFYVKFNNDCRLGKWNCYKVYTSLLQSGLCKLRRKSSDDVRKLYRGLHCSSPGETTKELCLPCFTSTSADLSTARNFGEYVITVESKTGPVIKKFSEYGLEHETLFSPFQVFAAMADKSSLVLQTILKDTLPFLLFPLFRGALLGSVVGNCIGAPFEFSATPTIDVLLKRLSLDENKAASKGRLHFTSDTSMILALADSLVKSFPLDIKVLRKSLSDAYIRDRNRNFGSSAAVILEELHRQTPTDDPFAPAKKVHGGSGSNGNGGAMRIVPAGLMNWNDTSDDSFIKKIGKITRLTHSNISGVNGAILQARAVQEAIMFSIFQERDATIRERYVDQLIKKMVSVETPANRPYSVKLKTVKGFLSSQPSLEVIRRDLGDGISAESSVSTAIYCFLRGMLPIQGIPEDRTEFERTIIYAVSLGGDTDTIASMAGAIAGAYYGQDSISQRWRDICEAKAIEDAKRYAKEIHGLVFPIK